MTFMLSIGKWGGIYPYFSSTSWRICLGFVAFSIVFREDAGLIELTQALKEARTKSDTRAMDRI